MTAAGVKRFWSTRAFAGLTGLVGLQRGDFGLEKLILRLPPRLSPANFSAPKRRKSNRSSQKNSLSHFVSFPIRFTLHEIRFTLMLFKPMHRHQFKVPEIDPAITVYIPRNDSLARRGAEIRFTRLDCPAVCAHIDYTSIWKRL